MLNKIIAIALAGSFTLSLAQGGGTTLAGKMTWVTGTLASAVTIPSPPTAQTIQITVGDVTDTFPDTLVTGAAGTVIPAGTSVAFLEKGSEPFEGTYNGDRNSEVYDPFDGSGITFARTIPVTDFGALEYNVATVIGSTGGELVFNLPSCTNGPYTFTNGVTAAFTATVSSYSLTIPTTETTESTVIFPNGSLPYNSVQFSAYGNGTMTFQGAGVGNSISVAGNFTGTATIFTNTSLSITTAP